MDGSPEFGRRGPRVQPSPNCWSQVGWAGAATQAASRFALARRQANCPRGGSPTMLIGRLEFCGSGNTPPSRAGKSAGEREATSEKRIAFPRPRRRGRWLPHSLPPFCSPACSHAQLPPPLSFARWLRAVPPPSRWHYRGNGGGALRSDRCLPKVRCLLAWR